MKEEVGMKRRGPMKALVGVAATGLVAFMSSAAFAAVDTGHENIFTNATGVNGAEGTISPMRNAGPSLNPGGTGQLLIGDYYDVRAVTNPNSGVSDAQNVNIQLINTNPNDGTVINGGILARIRFRDSKISRELLDFDIVLSCAEVWTANLVLRDDGRVAVQSNDPIVVQTTDTQITTDDIITAPGQVFAQPNALSLDDLQRGYFEVIAMEALPCEPADGQFTRDGDTWNRQVGAGFCPSDPACVPTNALGGTVFHVRPQAGISYQYNMTAISRFIQEGSAGIISPITTPLPTIQECIMPDPITGNPSTDTQRCRDQISFLIAKSRIMFHYDDDDTTQGETIAALSMPTKGFYCSLAPTGDEYNGVAVPPFSCLSTTNGGEEIVCTVYNRLEDLIIESNIFSPATQTVCSLPREVTFLGVRQVGNDARADTTINTATLPRNPESGWLDLNLDGAGTIANPVGGHGLDRAQNDLDYLGLGFDGFRGLPVLGNVIQEFFNGNSGGVFGNSVPVMYEVAYSATS